MKVKQPLFVAWHMQFATKYYDSNSGKRLVTLRKPWHVYETICKVFTVFTVFTVMNTFSVIKRNGINHYW